jgi:hypothetical protein
MNCERKVADGIWKRVRVVLLTFTTVSIAGCSSNRANPPATEHFVSAEAIQYRAADGSFDHRVAHLKGPQLTQLLEFFPRFENRRPPLGVGSWKARAELRLIPESGPFHRIDLSPDLRRWVDDKGEGSLSPSFQRFYETLPWKEAQSSE